MKKMLKCLYNLDFIGPSPKLYIFEKERYQSLFSLFFSLLIIIISIAFILYSLVTYIKFDRPNIVYSKSNDQNEKREIYIKDSLLMFQIIDSFSFAKINESIAYLEAEYSFIFDNATYGFYKLNVEKCQIGYNINSEYKKVFKEKFSSLASDYINFHKTINEFYCINNNNNDLSLFYAPNIGFNNINLNIIFKNQSKYSPENISLMMIYENNLINHNDKNNPISKSFDYNFIRSFNSFDYTSINFNFQYLKYETDEGLFFEDLISSKGMSFLDMVYYKNTEEVFNLDDDFLTKNFSKIGTIIFSLNKSYYDYYIRTYKKVQTLLAEIMSIVSLLFEIGRQVLYFLNDKKMSIDIVRKLFTNLENKNDIKNKNSLIIKTNINKNKYTSFKLNMIKKTDNIDTSSNKSDNKNKNIISFNNYKSDRIQIASENMNISFNLNKNKDKVLFSNIKRKEDILQKINIFNIVKSSFCCSNKNKLISLCHELIINDMSVENILERFYKLENIFNSVFSCPKYNQSKFKEIKSIIDSIRT